MAAPMILEGVLTTRGADAGAHLAPMGFRREGDRVLLAPFVPSTTLDNLRAHPQAVMNLTDDVRVVAGCLTGRRDWPLNPATRVEGWRLDGALACLELAVRHCNEDPQRPRFELEILVEAELRPYRGFNRAQAAVIEAAILVSRLDFLDPHKLARELAYLHIAVSKTAGEHERTAWHWLVDAAAAHPRMELDVDSLRCE